jgi:pyruvate-formate lyase-activating enzyme
MTTTKVFWIDIAGTCNLRCPSCAVGNYTNSDFVSAQRPVGFMELEYFQKVLAKIAEENSDSICRIEIYNWGEPLLHPQIAQFIREINSYPKFRCGISSNLSHRRMDLEGALLQNPFSIRVSISGFYANSYSQTHVRGDIELVKSNMLLMRRIIDEHKLKTVVTVAYHIYKHNAGEELDAMRQFCEENRFILTPDWANFYPLEKLQRYFAGGASAAELALIEKLVFTPEEQLDQAHQFANLPCTLQSQTAINYDGSVALCCAVYDPANNISGDFLQTPANVLTSAKLDSAMCNECIASNHHAMMCGYAMADKDQLGSKRVKFADGWLLKGNRLVRDTGEA